MASDHRPVSAWFYSRMRQIIPDKVRAIYQELLFSVDKWINASTPKLVVENRIFDFGKVTFEHKYTHKMTLINQSGALAEWSFVPKNDDLHVCQPWLRFSPSDGVLVPEERLDVSVTLHLTNDLGAILYPRHTGPLVRTLSRWLTSPRCWLFATD